MSTIDRKIDRYLTRVCENLPIKYRSRASKELNLFIRETILETAGKDPDILAVRKVLEEMGKPEDVAFSWLEQFESEPGYKVLLCHHPEYYDKYIRQYAGIDLVLAGHTHGGQIRFFGKGLFAHGQGLFPKYSGGVCDGGRLIVSRGLANTSRILRFHNPPELVFVKLERQE